MSQNGRSRFAGFLLGDHVALVRGAVDSRGDRPLPAGTCGTVVGYARDLPQVDFGAGRIVFVAPHLLELPDLPEGIVLPDDGDSLFTWDLFAALAKAQSGGAS